MEECRLPADAGLIDRCAGIDVRTVVEEKSDRCEVAVFRGHMQERSSLKRELAPAGHAPIEFREPFIHECRVRVNLRRQTIEPAAEQLQHGWRVVPGRAAGLEKDVNAAAQSLRGTRVRGDDVIESRAWIWMAGCALPRVATVRIGAVIEKPFESGRIQ